MFRETLLESADAKRKRNRWPIVTAFAAEIMVGALLVILPLVSTGVISVAANTPEPISFQPVSLAPRPAATNDVAVSASAPASGRFVTVSTTNPNGPFFGPPVTDCCADETSADLNIGSDKSLPKDLVRGGNQKPVPAPLQRVRVSVMAEGQLVTRVQPVYPRLAIVTNTEGEVALHAIIARDGSIQSLSVVKGAPMLAAAALDAVRQWRYKPYVLNGQAVEVETLITVNFKKTND